MALRSMHVICRSATLCYPGTQTHDCCALHLKAQPTSLVSISQLSYLAAQDAYVSFSGCSTLNYMLDASCFFCAGVSLHVTTARNPSAVHSAAKGPKRQQLTVFPA